MKFLQSFIKIYENEETFQNEKFFKNYFSTRLEEIFDYILINIPVSRMIEVDFQ